MSWCWGLGSKLRNAKELVAYVRQHRSALQARPTAFFSVSMSAAKPNAGVDPNGYLAAFCKQVQWEPTIRRAFAGGLPFRKYGFFTRLMMKGISRATHGPTDTSRDHEFTNWADVDAFALSIGSFDPRTATPVGGATDRMDA